MKHINHTNKKLKVAIESSKMGTTNQTIHLSTTKAHRKYRNSVRDFKLQFRLFTNMTHFSMTSCPMSKLYKLYSDTRGGMMNSKFRTF